MAAASSSETLMTTYQTTRLKKTQKTSIYIYIFTAVKTSNLALYVCFLQLTTVILLIQRYRRHIRHLS
jgi:hypothetical protein